MNFQMTAEQRQKAIKDYIHNGGKICPGCDNPASYLSYGRSLCEEHAELDKEDKFYRWREPKEQECLMKTCTNCGTDFMPNPKAPWAAECLSCWKAKRDTQNGIQRTFTSRKSNSGDRRAFAMAYAKDLCVAGKIEIKDLSAYAEKMLAWMEDQPITVQTTVNVEQPTPPTPFRAAARAAYVATQNDEIDLNDIPF